MAYYPKLWRDLDNPAGPWLRFSCSAETGATTTISVERSWDDRATWDAPASVVAGIPAQKVDVRGRGQAITLCYHDGGGAIHALISSDDGATWT